MDNIRFGSFVAQLRKERGLTQKELAQQDKFTLKLVNDRVDTCADALYEAICRRIGSAE